MIGISRITLPKVTLRVLLLPQVGLTEKAHGLLSREYLVSKSTFRDMKSREGAPWLSRPIISASATATKHDGAKEVDWSNPPAMTLTLELTTFH